MIPIKMTSGGGTSHSTTMPPTHSAKRQAETERRAETERVINHAPTAVAPDNLVTLIYIIR